MLQGVGMQPYMCWKLSSCGFTCVLMWLVAPRPYIMASLFSFTTRRFPRRRGLLRLFELHAFNAWHVSFVQLSILAVRLFADSWLQ